MTKSKQPHAPKRKRNYLLARRNCGPQMNNAKRSGADFSSNTVLVPHAQIHIADFEDTAICTVFKFSVAKTTTGTIFLMQFIQKYDMILFDK